MIFGSTAVKHFYPDFREPNDLDIIGEEQKVTRDVQVYWIPEFEELIELSQNKEYLDPELLLTNKAAHANWNVHWEKTMSDILFLKNKGHRINKALYKKLKKGWKNVHGRESAPLKNISRDEFFSDAVDRIYEHDSVHEAIAFYDKPIFEKILVEVDRVFCSAKKFEELTLDDKLKMAKEEIYVTALERYIFPNNGNYSKGKAYNASLKKFVTTMSSGWMSYFLIDNFKDLIYDGYDYVGNLKKEKLIKIIK